MEEKKLVPKRRFKGFKGKWKEMFLGDLSDSLEYGLNAESKKYDGENKYIRITDIDDDTRLFIKDDLTSPNIDYTISDKYLLDEGDILLARTGASVGKTYRYDKLDGKVYYAGFLIRARIKNGYNSEFIFQNTLTKKYKNFVDITSQRSGQPGINAQEYSNYKLLIPTLKEQQKIGEFFKVLDKRIANQERKITKVKALKSAYLNEMLPQKGENVPKRRFKGYTEKWNYCLLKEVINSEFKGKAKAEMQGGNSPYLDTNYLNGGEISYVNLPNDVEKDDVLILWDGSQAGMVYHGFEGALGSTLKAYKPKYSGEFLYQFLKKNQKVIFEQYRTPNIPHVINTFVDEFWICMPSIEEQQKIGEFFKNLDDQITTEEKKLEKLKKMKEAYLEEMFV